MGLISLFCQDVPRNTLGKQYRKKKKWLQCDLSSSWEGCDLFTYWVYFEGRAKIHS